MVLLISIFDIFVFDCNATLVLVVFDHRKVVSSVHVRKLGFLLLSVELEWLMLFLFRFYHLGFGKRFLSH